jgi:hypothetical protein
MKIILSEKQNNLLITFSKLSEDERRLHRQGWNTMSEQIRDDMIILFKIVPLKHKKIILTMNTLLNSQ